MLCLTSLLKLLEQTKQLPEKEMYICYSVYLFQLFAYSCACIRIQLRSLLISILLCIADLY